MKYRELYLPCQLLALRLNVDGDHLTTKMQREVPIIYRSIYIEIAQMNMLYKYNISTAKYTCEISTNFLPLDVLKQQRRNERSIPV